MRDNTMKLLINNVEVGISKIDLNESDVLVLKVPNNTNRSTLNEMSKSLTKLLPNTKVIALPEDYTILTGNKDMLSNFIDELTRIRDNM